MNISRIINFICIVTGGLVALYAQAQKQQNIYLLIVSTIIQTKKLL